MSPAARDANALAKALLDAQVDFVIAELSGKKLTAAVARDVDEILAFAAQVTVASLVDPDAVKAAARQLIDALGGSPIIDELRPAFADAIYDAAASDQHLLGDVVGREHVDALFAKLIGMHRLQDRAFERLNESPIVAGIASTYVTKIVGDFVQQNRQRAEKVPGMSSLFSIGAGAANRVKSTADQFLGDAQQRSAQFAMRQTTGAMRDLMRDAPLREAAMQLWDLQAEEPVSALREYLTAQDLRDILAIMHDIVATARNLDYVGLLVDECIEVFFDRYGEQDVASLLAELGLTRSVLIAEIRRFASPVVTAAKADGRLDAFVRTRLEPFFTAPSTLALLGAEQPKSRPKPAKDR